MRSVRSRWLIPGLALTMVSTNCSTGDATGSPGAKTSASPHTLPSATVPAPTASSTSAARRVATTASAVLDCAHHIQAHRLAADQQVVFGVVALSTSPRAPALQATSDPSEPAATRYFAKDGLLVRAGSTFQLTVPEDAGRHAVIGWGGETLKRTRRLMVSCPRQTSEAVGWVAYVGGYWVAYPACISLIVRAAGQQQRVNIGIGVACPRQRPPRP